MVDSWSPVVCALAAERLTRVRAPVVTSERKTSWEEFVVPGVWPGTRCWPLLVNARKRPSALKASAFAKMSVSWESETSTSREVPAVRSNRKRLCSKGSVPAGVRSVAQLENAT